MDLVRDCLDKQLIDRHGRKMGRVDGIVLTIEKGKRPRVTYVETGTVTRLMRVHERLGRWIAEMLKKCGLSDQPCRIPWSKIRVQRIDVSADVDAEKMPALELERWLRKHIVNRIPGA